jgi:hypothetical protein
MRRVFVPFLIGVFLWSSLGAWGKQGSAAPATADSEHQAIQYQAIQSDPRADTRGCDDFFDALRAARQDVERDRRNLPSTSDSGSAIAMNDEKSSHANLQQDLLILDQKETEFNRCSASNNRPGAMPDPPSGCSSETLLNFQVSHRGEAERYIPIWHLPGSPVFFYESGMTIDADGAPNAYHPDNTGLDDLKNAGSPGNWEGLAKDRDGEPFVQGPDDPFPGYYVSETALADRSKPVNDPTRYVDASKVPFIVLPGAMARQFGARPGDFAEVLNLGNGKSSHAIFGDVGPFDRIGEGSVALAENLGIRSDARNGGARRGILYLVFPGSGNGQPRSVDEINAETERLVQDWGGNSQLTVCTAEQPSPPFEGNRNTN